MPSPEFPKKIPGDPRHHRHIEEAAETKRRQDSLDKSYETGEWEERGALNKLSLANLMSKLEEKYDIRLDKGSKILEIGTGAGASLRRFKNEGYDIVGIDARPRHKEELPIVHARIEDLPFATASFELVIAGSVFDSYYYEQDQPAMLKEIIRVLKPGGIFFNGFRVQDPFNETERSRPIRAEFKILSLWPDKFPGTIYQKLPWSLTKPDK
jgi:SAM-dependent methyltransferase